MPAPPPYLQEIAAAYRRETFEPPRARARLRLEVTGAGAWDAILEHGTARLAPPAPRPEAVISAEPGAWQEFAREPARGVSLFRSGRLRVRRNLHLGAGFLIAASGAGERIGARFETLRTRAGRISTLQAGSGPALVAIHGLGATKGSFLPTVVELSHRFRVIAFDLPGFGDSDKPLRARYDAPFFARSVIGLLDALGIERAHLVGNSLGGRVALEMGMSHPERVERLALLCPALAWRRARPLVPLMRMLRPELGMLQLAPRRVVEELIGWLVPNAREGWTAAGVDEFLRAYLTPAGRAAFYAAARNLYLDEPHGRDGFWTRLASLRPHALFVWGESDRLIPLAFARHVREALPDASHLTLDCGHVPQIEKPRRTHLALESFLAGAAPSRRRREALRTRGRPLADAS